MSPEKDCFFFTNAFSKSSSFTPFLKHLHPHLFSINFIHTTTKYNTTEGIYYPNLIQIILTLLGIDPLTLQLCILRLLLSHPQSPPVKRRSLVYTKVHCIIDNTIQTKEARHFHWYVFVSFLDRSFVIVVAIMTFDITMLAIAIIVSRIRLLLQLFQYFPLVGQFFGNDMVMCPHFDNRGS